MPFKKKQPPDPTFDWFAWMQLKRVKLQPVVSKGGQTIEWRAGHVHVASDGWTNIVKVSESGATPLEALAALKSKYRAKR